MFTKLALALVFFGTANHAPCALHLPFKAAVVGGASFEIAVPAPHTAFSRIHTPENEAWFAELIDLNPGCTVMVVGQGIVVSKEPALVLPETPKPADVVLVSD